MSQELTLRQQKILHFIKSFTESHGYPPTIREIGQGFEIAPPSVLAHLKALQKKGYIRRLPSKPRCLEILKDSETKAA